MWSRFISYCSTTGLIITLSTFFLLILPAFFRSSPAIQSSRSWNSVSRSNATENNKLNVFVVDLPPEFNYGLLRMYWEFQRTNDRNELRSEYVVPLHDDEFPPYAENPLIKQYSAEYWLLGDLMTPENQRGNSVARRVSNSSFADVIFVPFFATLSAELQLHEAKGKFRRKKGNADYDRQVRVMEWLKRSPEWQRSGGRDHVFVLTDPVAMWHVRSELAPAVLLIVDFGGWYMEDAKAAEGRSEPLETVQHRQVSLLKDVVIPYTHLLPVLHLTDDQQRNIFLYFKGARHRHRTGLVRDKLWAVLKHEQGVVLEEGFPDSTGREQALKAMRNAEFCLHPAGDTPTSCRLFDAIASLCIPVIVSDTIELPFEGMLDYTEFCIFVAVQQALQPKFLVQYLESIPVYQRKVMRSSLAKVQYMFEYENGFAAGIGPVLEKGAVNLIWTKVLHKVPTIKEAIMRERRKVPDALIPARCHCL